MTPTELRATLAQLRLRQVALARELGVHRVTVARWVAGKVEVPRHVAAWLALYARSAGPPPSREEPTRRFPVDGTVGVIKVSDAQSKTTA
jgi:hypothetical protein